MSGSTYPIKGIPLIPGEPIPTRKEITLWYNDSKYRQQVSLFMHALTTLKSMPVEELLGFFRISGIHSYPLASWDGVPPVTTDNPPGYCNHNLVTFPTWHRPYMLLYEQVIYSHMEKQIDAWKAEGRFGPGEEEIWRAEAKRFRLPYWDWARKQEYTKGFGIPQVCITPEIRVAMPGGGEIPITNPLTGYTNPKTNAAGENVKMGDNSMGIYKINDDNDPQDPSQDLPWSECIGVSRWGINTDKPVAEWTKGINDWEQVNDAMNDPLWYGQGSGSFSDAVARMLSPNYFSSWETFASTAHNNPSSATNYMSLEFIHNVIHNTTGGTYKNASQVKQAKSAGAAGYKGIGLGHMCDVPVAAFDPIFYFHHCNVDRLAAIWQALNPTLWFNDPQPGDPAPTSSLLPFHYNTQGGFWTSDMCRNTKNLNYVYDDLVVGTDALNPDGSVNQTKYIEDLRAHIDELYLSTHHIVKTIPGYVSERADFNDYVVNIVYDRYALGGRAYSILFFLGTPPDDLSSYRNSRNFAGQVYTFSFPMGVEDGNQTCGNCKDQKENQVLSKAQIPLTLPLLAKIGADGSVTDPGWIPAGSGADGLQPEIVADILEQELNWVFVEIGGKERPNSDFPNTEIAVLYGKGQLPSERDDARKTAPSYGGYKKLSRATESRELGSSHADTRLSLIRDDE